MTESSNSPFSPPPPQSNDGPSQPPPSGHSGGGDGPRPRRRRGGRNRGRSGGGGGGGQQQHPPVRYEDEPEDPWATEQQALHEEGAAEEARPHHDKIELPEAFAKLGLETALLHALAEINFKTP